ncbi:MAG: hypothetical protein O9313_00125 [Acetobacteraceae bacterium]|jgi:hypothetical protein|nr:hypothetical protein [Acetobacteraceae bacterium]
MSLYVELRDSTSQLRGMIRDVKHTIDQNMGRYASAPGLHESQTRISLILEEARLLLTSSPTSRALDREARLNVTSEMLHPRSDVIGFTVDVTEKALRKIEELLSEATREPMYQKISEIPLVRYRFMSTRKPIWPQGYSNTTELPNPGQPSKRDGEFLLIGGAMTLISENIEETRRIMRAMRLAQELMDPSPQVVEGSSDLIDLARLKSILPTQKIAPLQFEIVQDKLRILPRSSKPEEVSSISAAKVEILEMGGQIVLELERSNCDRRLLDAIKKTQAQINSEENIVRIAISGIYCGNLAKAFQPELAGAVDVMLSTYSMTIGMYAAQFPEWRNFLENSASTEIDESDLSVIQTAITSLADNLERNPGLVDPEVPRTLREISQFIQDPRQSAKRMAFAAIRTAENLVISIWSHSADFLGRKLEKTKEIGSSVAARVVVLSLLVIALDAAVGISPLTSKISEMNWMRSAIELVERQRTRLMQD